ncbi:MAG: response regulator [Deltaproteobacteria bacterium]|nr:MAG: response regulator [Deltaproteobacteria bacterium]
MAEDKKLPLILVVDDNDEIRSMVVDHLESLQCDVLEANNGEDGLAAILANKPDLVLLDVMMPGLNGWEVAKYVRERPEFDTMGVIMVTAIGEAVNDMTSPLYGADDHIDKPFQLSELSFKIRKTLAKKRKEKLAEEEADA